MKREPTLNALGAERHGPTLASALMLWALSAVSAQTVLIESRVALANSDPAYAEIQGNWQNSSAKSSASDLTGGTGSRFATADDATFSVTPMLDAGGTYFVEVTHGFSPSIPTDLLVGVSVVGGSGLPGTTPEFNQEPDNVWRRIGTLQVDAGQSMPTLTFTKLAGSSGTGQRFYMDAIRFVNAGDPCLQGPPQVATVNGPLAAGQTFVNVPNVDATATKVTVYADGVAIGERATGVTPGLNVVPCAALVKGTQITATQTAAAGIEGCRPATGPLVGGGPNPVVRLSLSVKQDINLTGPIGTNGGAPTLPLYFLAASGPAAGFGTAPLDGKVFQPGACWQTVTFLRGPDPALPTDPGYFWANPPAGGSVQLDGDFGILDALAISIEDLTDTGPYRIYLDNLMNGDVVIQDFEGTALGTNALFHLPDFSGSTSPFLLAQPPGNITPNLCVVTNSNADTGTNSLLVSWQFKDATAGNWLRLVAQGPGTPNPQVDLRLPISFRMLLLPVGVDDGGLRVTRLTDQTVHPGGTATFQVIATGTGSFTYVWKFGDTVIPGQTTDTLTVRDVGEDDVGVYTVEVSNGTCATRASARLATGGDVFHIITIGGSGSTVTLTWSSGGVLQSAPSLPGSFADVPGASSPYTVVPQAAAQRFFRLRQ